VPHRVVDRFEAIEVEVQDGEPAPVRLRRRHDVDETLLERETVRQAGEAVRMRRLGQLSLRGLELGDVDRDARGAGDGAVRVGLGLDVMAQPSIARCGSRRERAAQPKTSWATFHR